MESSTIDSPCVAVCALDEKGVCLGCYRTGDEITDWFMADDQRKQEILREAALRRDAFTRIKLL
ncbi:MAG: DUF1289 domain-containing protein [Luminiphilus sp.]|nr:DUF1289 domain-containing protein [Luminiphilus sp.]